MPNPTSCTLILNPDNGCRCAASSRTLLPTNPDKGHSRSLLFEFRPTGLLAYEIISLDQPKALHIHELNRRVIYHAWPTCVSGGFWLEKLPLLRLLVQTMKLGLLSELVGHRVQELAAHLYTEKVRVTVQSNVQYNCNVRVTYLHDKPEAESTSVCLSVRDSLCVRNRPAVSPHRLFHHLIHIWRLRCLHDWVEPARNTESH